jgi:hypothetical protein
MSDAPPKSGEATELDRVQRWFHAVVTHPDGVETGADSENARALSALGANAIEKLVTRSKALTAAERLGIYANAYYTRLLECLGEVFPIVKRALGDEAFEGFAFGYLQKYPSRSHTLNELGRDFPRYLSETRPSPEAEQDEQSVSENAGESEARLTPEWPDFLIDLARLEWAIYEVFDGPGVEGERLLSADDLLDISPDHWAQSRLQTVPCLQLLATRFPVNAYYSAARATKDDESIPLPAPAESFVALTRRESIVRRYHLSRPEFELLNAILEGRTVGEAIERAAAVAGDDFTALAANLQLWFRNWTAEGFFQSVRRPEDLNSAPAE